MVEPDEGAAIVRAAWSVLERTGFEGFKVQGVLRSAGISARSFYRHFGGKDDLIAALELDEHERAAARLRRIVPAVGDPAERVGRFVTAMIDLGDDPVLAARIRLFVASPVALVDRGVAIATATDRVCERLRAALIDGVAAGDFPQCDPDRDGAVIYQLASGVMNAVVHGRTQRTSGQSAADAARFVLRSLRSP
jgi:AcrR family transcriptional regulator